MRSFFIEGVGFLLLQGLGEHPCVSAYMSVNLRYVKDVMNTLTGTSEAHYVCVAFTDGR